MYFKGHLMPIWVLAEITGRKQLIQAKEGLNFDHLSIELICANKNIWLFVTGIFFKISDDSSFWEHLLLSRHIKRFVFISIECFIEIPAWKWPSSIKSLPPHPCLFKTTGETRLLSTSYLWATSYKGFPSSPNGQETIRRENNLLDVCISCTPKTNKTLSVVKSVMRAATIYWVFNTYQART